MRRAARTDANHAAIRDLLVRCGCSVQSLAAVGKGVPDLLVGRFRRTYLVEVKTDRGELTDDQALWHARWRGQIVVLRSVMDAARWINETVRQA